MRILLAECKQEVSSFNPVLSRYEDFETGHGQEILDYHQGINTEMARALDVFTTMPDTELAPALPVGRPRFLCSAGENLLATPATTSLGAISPVVRRGASPLRFQSVEVNVFRHRRDGDQGMVQVEPRVLERLETRFAFLPYRARQ